MTSVVVVGLGWVMSWGPTFNVCVCKWEQRLMVQNTQLGKLWGMEKDGTGICVTDLLGGGKGGGI